MRRAVSDERVRDRKSDWVFVGHAAAGETLERSGDELRGGIEMPLFPCPTPLNIITSPLSYSGR